MSKTHFLLTAYKFMAFLILGDSNILLYVYSKSSVINLLLLDTVMFSLLKQTSVYTRVQTSLQICLMLCLG